MSEVGKLEKKKAVLSILSSWCNYAITSIIALIAFIFVKFNETNTWLLVLSIFAVISLGIVIFVLQIRIKKIIDEIGEL